MEALSTELIAKQYVQYEFEKRKPNCVWHDSPSPYRRALSPTSDSIIKNANCGDPDLPERLFRKSVFDLPITRCLSRDSRSATAFAESFPGTNTRQTPNS